jgi:hypothetical protein
MARSARDRPLSPSPASVILGLVALVTSGCGGPFGGPFGGPVGGPVGMPEPDPNVRGGFGGGFHWAIDQPTHDVDPIDPAEAADLVADIRDSIDEERDEIPQLTGYLTANGCRDIRVGLVDFDAVRGD